MQFLKSVAIIATVLALMTSRDAVAIGSKAPQNSSGPENAMMPLVAPLLIQEPGVTNTLTLVSNSEAAMRVKIAVRDRLGHEIAGSVTTLQPHSQARFDVTSLLKDVLGDARFIGYALVSSDDANFASLAAQLSVMREEPQNPVYVEEELLMLGMKPNNSFRATLASAAAPAIIAVANLDKSRQTITVSCIAEKKQAQTSAVSLAPGQMMLLNVCNERVLFQSPRALIAPDEKFSTSRAIGVSVSSPGMPGGLAVYGLGYIDSLDRIRPVALPFQQTAFTYSSSSIFAGVPIGRPEALGFSLFKAGAGIANFGATTAHVSVQYAGTGEDGHAMAVV